MKRDAVAYFVLGLALVMVSSCGTAVQSSGGVVPGQIVQQKSKLLILPLADAVDKGGSTLGGSGGGTTAALRDALVAHGFAPVVGDSKSLADAFAEADKLGSKYVLKGSLVNWEDNATEWSGRPDTAGISLELYDAATKVLVASSTQNFRASTVSFTSGSPDRFIPQLTDLALSKIFGWRPSAASGNS